MNNLPAARRQLKAQGAILNIARGLEKIEKAQYYKDLAKWCNAMQKDIL